MWLLARLASAAHCLDLATGPIPAPSPANQVIASYLPVFFAAADRQSWARLPAYLAFGAQQRLGPRLNVTAGTSVLARAADAFADRHASSPETRLHPHPRRASHNDTPSPPDVP